jgi:3-oxoacyl-[acyl-carrier-protein] synthase II
MSSSARRRVVVTGLGALTPIGNTVSEFWNGLMAGRSGAGPITLIDASPFPTRFACEVKGFDPSPVIDPKEARRMDRFTQFAIMAAHEAVTDAGLTADGVDRTGVGVIVGSGIGGIIVFEEQTRAFIEKGPRRINPFFVPMMISDIACGHISMMYGFHGPNFSVVSACSTAGHATHTSFRLIQAGEADVIVTGGAEAAISNMGLGGFCSMKALSTRNDEPTRASRPFDKDRDGFVMGEGAGILVLEELEHAKARGAKIYAELLGAGASGDAYHITAPHPEGVGARRAMQAAIKDAGIEPSAVDYVNAHGTSTDIGDPIESRAIRSVFGAHADRLAVSSTKSMTGHCLGAAGAVEAIAAIMATRVDMLPPTINLENQDPACDLYYVPNKAEARRVNVALSNCFGFGGHNSSLTFAKPDFRVA